MALGWAFALVLPACFSSHGPQDSTQTGNPPTIDMGRVALKVTADAVHVTGEKGAVKPGGSAVEVTNLTTGKVVKTSANADGSFDAHVDGSPNDAFAVKASSGGMSSGAVYVVRGSAAVGSGKGGSLSCDQRDQLAASVLDQAAMQADKSCTVDADCDVVRETSSCGGRCPSAVVSQAGQRAVDAAGTAINAGLCASYAKDGCVSPIFHCPAFPLPQCIAGMCTSVHDQAPLSCEARSQMASDQLAAAVDAADKQCMVDSDCVAADTQTVCDHHCGPAAVSQAGAASIAGWVTRIDKVLCGSFQADGCMRPAVLCPTLGPSVVCAAGQCVFGFPAPDAGTPQGCLTCFDQSITWGPNGGLAAYTDQSTLAPCAHYTRTRKPAGDPNAAPLACETDLIACNAVTSTGAVLSALDNSDVKQALAMGMVLYGTDTRPVDGTVFEIRIGTSLIDVGGSCDGAPPNCIPPPAGVQMLVSVLESIDSTFAANEPSCKGFAM